MPAHIEEKSAASLEELLDSKPEHTSLTKDQNILNDFEPDLDMDLDLA